jgi:hypothetical protein
MKGTAGPNGVYELVAYPGVFIPYQGPNRARSIYVVGYGTEHERLFRHTEQRNEAIAYGKALDLDLSRVAATSLPWPAVAELFNEVG